jgi:hypothetical protein
MLDTLSLFHPSIPYLLVLFWAMKVSFTVVNGLALLAALVSPVLAKNKFPYCTGSTYGITHKNCAKFKFDTLHTNCVETSNCTTYVQLYCRNA